VESCSPVSAGEHVASAEVMIKAPYNAEYKGTWSFEIKKYKPEGGGHDNKIYSYVDQSEFSGKCGGGSVSVFLNARAGNESPTFECECVFGSEHLKCTKNSSTYATWTSVRIKPGDFTERRSNNKGSHITGQEVRELKFRMSALGSSPSVQAKADEKIRELCSMGASRFEENLFLRSDCH